MQTILNVYSELKLPKRDNSNWPGWNNKFCIETPCYNKEQIDYNYSIRNCCLVKIQYEHKGKQEQNHGIC